MPRGRRVELRFPVGGNDKSTSYQRQRPFTTIDALNVRPNSTVEDRDRGGSRPGLSRTHGNLQLGGASESGTAQGGAVGSITLASSASAVDDFYEDRRIELTGGTGAGQQRTCTGYNGGTNVAKVKPDWTTTPDVTTTYSIHANQDFRLLDTVTSAVTDKSAVIRDDFVVGATPDVLIVGNWSAWSFSANLPAYGPEWSPFQAGYRTITSAQTTRGARIENVGNFNESANYRLRAKIASQTFGSGNVLRLFIKVNDTGALTNWYDNGGIRIELYREAGTGQLQARMLGYNADGTLVYDSGIQPGPTNLSLNEVELRWTASTSVAELYIGGTQFITNTFTGADILGAVGAHVGFEVQVGPAVPEEVFIDWLEFDFFLNVDADTSRTYLVGSADGTIYYDADQGVWSASIASSLINANERVRSVDRLQKLYIADHGLQHTGTNGACLNNGNKQFTSVGAEFVSNPIVVAGDSVLVILSGTNVTAGTYAISTVDSDTQVTLTTDPVSGGDASGVTYRIERQPKIFDPVADTLVPWTASNGGSIPIGCPIVGVYHDRLVLAGALRSPHIWYMSRQGDPLDWDTGASATDTQRAVAGTVSDAGRVGSPIRAVMLHSDDFLLFGCDTQLYLLRGDPALGGQLDILSNTIGILSADAWCRGPEGETLWLSRDGFYALAPGAGAYPQSISRERMPRELIDVNISDNYVSMAYDTVFRGVCIFITPKRVGGANHWWFDWETKSFWRMTFQADHEPTVVKAYASQDVVGQDALMLGGRDGYLRKFDRNAETDDGSSIANHVYYGPLGGNGTILLDSMQAVLGKNSGDVTCSVHVGDTPEDAFAATALDTGTFVAGLNYDFRPMAGGGAVYVKLAGSGTTAWSIESLLAELRPYGPLRKG